MTIDEARRMKGVVYRYLDLLSRAFPCEDCEGTGDTNFRGGMYSRCDECYGMGFQLPEDEEEEE
jgi:DnaJ-class molecular chaperone